MSQAEPIYRKYRRTQIAEMADWEPGFDMTNVSVSAPDMKAGSPKLGDKIARNSANHDDRWLVAKAYFEANFEEVIRMSQAERCPRCNSDDRERLEYPCLGSRNPNPWHSPPAAHSS